jgi:hypothetical protein
VSAIDLFELAGGFGLLVFSRRKINAPVLLPARLVRLGALRTLFPIADVDQPIAGDAELGQEFLGRGGTPIAQREVVLCRAPLVPVTFDGSRLPRIRLLAGYSSPRCGERCGSGTGLRCRGGAGCLGPAIAAEPDHAPPVGIMIPSLSIPARCRMSSPAEASARIGTALQWPISPF